MARFLLFAGETYYARGRAHDLIDGFGSQDEAEAYGKALLSDDSWYFDWYHVFDIGTSTIVAKSDTQAHGWEDAP